MIDPLQLSLDDLRTRSSIKWRRYPPDVLPLWVAEMDATLAPAVVDAVTDAVTRGDTGYPVAHPYAEALADFAERRWGWDMEVARASLVPDVMLGIVEVLGLVTDPGDAVIVNPPVYPPFYGFIDHARRRIVEAPLGADLRLDLDGLERAMAEATTGGRRAAYLLCSPHNPTGTVHTAEELAAVADLAARHGVRVVADEIHAPLVQPGARHLPYLSVPGAETGFALLSASKGWNLAGLKAAFAVAGPGAAAELATLPEIVGHGASHLAVLAHTAALRDSTDWLDGLLGSVAENQRLVGRLFAEHLPEVRYRPAEGTYLAWLDCRGLGLGDDPGKVFLKQGRVALHRGLDFGTGGRGHVRMNLATSPEILVEAVERMASVR
jgi:cysteine-S-conjugate beta-lyase